MVLVVSSITGLFCITKLIYVLKLVLRMLVLFLTTVQIDANPGNNI